MCVALRVCLQSCQPQPKGKQWKKEGIQGQEWVGGDRCKDGPKPVEFCPSSFLAFSHGEPAQHINEGAHGRSPHCRVPTEDLQSKGLHLRPCDQGSTSHCSQPKKKEFISLSQPFRKWAIESMTPISGPPWLLQLPPLNPDCSQWETLVSFF